MKEELYIYDSEGNRHEVDLGGESGITLKWESNLFNSVDKLNTSYSYTFKIPVTAKNEEAFDLAEDIRHKSKAVRKKMKAEYIRNGVSLLKNSYLYILQISDEKYQCCFVFDVLQGLQTLKDAGDSLNELRSALVSAGALADSDETVVRNMADFGCDIIRVTSKYLPLYDGTDSYKHGNPSDFDNEKAILYPNYFAGLPFYYNDANRNIETLAQLPPAPVMPVRHILELLKSAYGVSFSLGEHKSGKAAIDAFLESDKWAGENIITYGVLPLVGTEQTSKQEEAQSLTMSLSGDVILLGELVGDGTGWGKLFTFSITETSFGNGGRNWQCLWPVYGYTTLGILNEISTNPSVIIGHFSTTDEGKKQIKKVGVCANCEVELRGALRVRSSVEITYDEKDEYVSDNLLKLAIFKSVKHNYTQDNKWHSDEEQTIEHYKELGSSIVGDYGAQNVYVNGKFQYAEYYFIFDPDLGGEAVTFGEETVDPLKLTVEGSFSAYYIGVKWKKNETVEVSQITPLRFIPHPKECKKATHKIDTYSNLPDIGCLDFVKSLYYMLGAFPKINADGTIGANKYADFLKNINSGNVYDWSDKVLKTIKDAPSQIEHKAGDFRQKNYFLSKWDDLDRTEAELEEEEEVWEDGYGCININDATEDEETTIYTSPYYPPYKKNRKLAYKCYGDSVNMWKQNEMEVSYNSFNPVYGLLSSTWPKKMYLQYYFQKVFVDALTEKTINSTTSVNDGTNQLYMEVLNPFAEMDDNPNWAYLQRILENPLTITENVLLDELTLRDIDYVKPVYIQKYNSYFAISTIQLGKNGICKCELVKLPNVIKKNGGATILP